MAQSVTDLLNNINQYLTNPASLQQTILDFTKDATAGQYEYADPTNPVVNAIEAAVMTSAATVMSYESILRKQYPILAETYDDLFLHMADTDYLDRFSVPARTKFSLMFNKNEILGKMVLDAETGYKKITIPRNTYFTVSDTIFSLEYPIEIRQAQHGGIQVVYNTDLTSPIQELSTNLIQYDERQDNLGNRFINFEFDVLQVFASSKTFDLNASTRFSTTFPLSDYYYYTRVFIRADDNTWQEVYTTHSDVVYDPRTFTAILKVEDQNLTVSVPEIYTASGANNRKIRIDVYETKADIALMLDGFPNSSFSVTFRSLDESEMDQFTAPLQTLSTIIVYSAHSVVGGKKGLTFEQLRTRYITNSIGNPFIPISNIQIKNSLEDQNYEIVKNIDNITNRVFLASRNLPKPTNAKLITAANASIQTGMFTMSEAAQVNTVIDNGASITITPKTIFQNINGKLTLLASSELTAILNLPVDQRAIKVNTNNYYYSPFHYVLDASSNEFDVRPYYLDNPAIESKVFIGENDTTNLQVTINSYQIQKTDTKYFIQIELKGSDAFVALQDSEVYVQSRFKPVGETDYAYLNGTLIGHSDSGGRIYQFDLTTNFHVDSLNALRIQSYFMYTMDPKDLGAELFTEFEILFATTHPMDINYKRGDIDEALGDFLLPENIVGVSHEKLRVRFGYYLDKLWARSRTVVTEAAYARYATDVIDIYAENVYEINTATGTTVFIENGVPVRHLLHTKGDPVLIDGVTQYKHKAGDTILDSNGNPTIFSPRALYREIDYMLIEGSYWFATDSVAVSYRAELTDIFVDWIVNSLTDISQKLLEQTKIYFYPKTTTGLIDVMVKDGIQTTISASQSFTITLHVTGLVFSNLELRDQLKVKTIEVINGVLTQPVISISHLSQQLTGVYGSDVIDVEVSWLGDENNYSTVTVLNDTDRPSIRKNLKAQSDQSLIVEEAVELIFIRHELDS